MMSWLFWYCVLSHCFFTFILYQLTEDVTSRCIRENYSKDTPQTTVNTNKTNNKSGKMLVLQLGSSVWCYGHHRSERICKFRNLCYSSNLTDYLFFHGPATILEGVPDNRCSPALLDLSSVDDHNLQYFDYQDAPVEALKHFSDITMVEHASLIFHRFNPENLMHVIHDDLLPLFYTLRQYFPDFGATIQPFKMDVQLVFMEGQEEAAYFDFYELFSERKPMFKKLSLKNNSLLCFQEAVVGISKATTWYDYGFRVPQGEKINHTANGKIIHQFASYITKKLGVNRKTEPGLSDYVILFSREFNRLILNELEISFAVSTTFNLKVIRLSLETNNLSDIITSIRSSAGIIGMHGSILSLAVFLLPNSFLIELFPYAINPENYTPYKTLSQIPGMDISYGSWQNKIKLNTVVYPNRTKAEGGITHLSLKEQGDILTTDEIPKHLCCDDPYWLFRIYQDTIVDVESFVQVMQNTLDQRKAFSKKASRNIYAHPGKIRSVVCNGVETLSNGAAIFVAWQSPWNVQFFNSLEVEYEIWIQRHSDKEYMAYALYNVTWYTFTENVKHQTSYDIWVRGVLSGKTGPFSNVCTCVTH